MILFRVPRGAKGILIRPDGAVDAGWIHRKDAVYPLELTVADPVSYANDVEWVEENLLESAYNRDTGRYMCRLAHSGYTIFYLPGRETGMLYFFATKETRLYGVTNEA